MGAAVLDSAQVAAWLLERLGAQGTMAVVGNSPDLLEQSHGELIDRHELVLRMNAGVPGPEHREALGERTDVLAVGNLRVLGECRGKAAPDMLWFSKPGTRLGNTEWDVLKMERREAERHPEMGRLAVGTRRRAVLDAVEWGGLASLYRLPPERYPPLAEEVGAPPSGGLFVVSELLRHGLRGRLNLFGFSFFGAAGSKESWWHRERPRARIMQRHPHNGRKELAWFKAQGMVEKASGWATL